MGMLHAGEVIDQNELYRRRQNEYRNMRHTYIMTYIKCVPMGRPTFPRHLQMHAIVSLLAFVPVQQTEDFLHAGAC